MSYRDETPAGGNVAMTDITAMGPDRVMPRTFRINRFNATSRWALKRRERSETNAEGGALVLRDSSTLPLVD